MIPCGLTDGTACTLDAGGFGVCCDATCVETGVDPSNCDGCGHVCPQSASCRASTCTAGGAQATCGDGGCASGLACAGGYYCGRLVCPPGEVGGSCAVSATANQAGTCCDGTCADLRFDDSNCGACGAACADGGRCVDRGCLPVDCPAAGRGAGCAIASDGGSSHGLCCDGKCVDFSSDPLNCGGCGVDCASGICDGGCLPGPPDAGTGEVPDGGQDGGADAGTDGG